MKILVTGSAGFIGANLVLRLLESPESVRIVGLDNLNNYYDPSLKEYRLGVIETKAKEHPEHSYCFVNGSIADREPVNKLYDDLMVHFNGMPNVNPYSTIVTGWMMELLQKPNSVAAHEKALNMFNLVAVKEKDVDTFVKTNKMHHIAVQVQALNIGYAKNFSDMAQNIDNTLKSLVEAENYFRENEKS